ncbi:MAG: hypothetical protein WCK47_05525 [bacterium]|nr:hypothetical protein [Candidatus Sumerlaeota bacterium]
MTVQAETIGESTDPPPHLGLPMDYYRNRGQIPEAIPRAGVAPARAEDFQTSHMSVILDASGSYSIDLRRQTRVDNTSIRLTNMGTKPVFNPWVVMNGTRNWHDTTSILNEALGSELDPELRAFRLWEFLRVNRYHWYPAETTFEIHSLVKYLNVYGYGLCDDTATVLECLFKKAGFSAARCWDLRGHVISEVMCGDQYHILDADLEAFYPDWDNRTVSAVSLCAKQPALVERVTPGIGGLYSSTTNNAIFQNRWDADFTMAMTLRPGESLERCFTNWGKFHDNYCQQEPPVYANGRHCYSLPDDIRASGEDNSAEIVTTMSAPYLYAGGYVSARLKLADPECSANILFTKDQITGQRVRHQAWISVASFVGPSDGLVTASLDAAIAPRSSAACYGFQVKFVVNSAGKMPEAQASDMFVCGEIQCAPAALPTLVFDRRNLVNVTFDTAPGGLLQIEHVWEESNTETRIVNAWAPIDPPDRSTTSTTAPSLAWKSQMPDDPNVWRSVRLAWDKAGYHPVSPVTVADGNMPNEWTTPAGWLKTGNTYYWRIKDQDPMVRWSSPWSFSVTAPSLVTNWNSY